MWKWISRTLIVLAVLTMALRTADRLSRRAGPLPTVPQPNGYDTLLEVAASVSTPQGDLADLGDDAIHRLAETNRTALIRLHDALRASTAVPLRTERDWSDRHTADLKKLKRLAVVLSLQSRAEMLQGDTNRSAGRLLDVVLLGQALARGGLLVDGLNALAVETVGAASLRSQVAHLPADFCRSAAQDLEQAETRREQPERIFETEKNWLAVRFGLVSRVGGWIQRKGSARRHTEFRARYNETVKRTRGLILRLAAHAVELETGQRVTDPASLVPGVLQSVPMDPERRAPMTEIPGVEAVPAPQKP
jgi:hypothetical protein